MGTTIFKIGTVLSKTLQLAEAKQGCNAILPGNCSPSTKMLVFATDRLSYYMSGRISGKIMGRIPTEIDFFSV